MLLLWAVASPEHDTGRVRTASLGWARRAGCRHLRLCLDCRLAYDAGMLTDLAHVRPGRPEDAEALSRAFRESWLVAYNGMMPAPQLRTFVERRDAGWWRDALARTQGQLVVEVDGSAVGYVTFGGSRSALPYAGEIYELYVAPLQQGHGLGVQLFESARERLDRRDLKGLLVWALTDNTIACEFYRRRGGLETATAIERFGHKLLPKTAFGWQ